MGASGKQLDGYDAAHLREALGQDPRVGELGLHVSVAGDELFVRGTVPTQERRDAVGVVCREVLPGVTVHNEVAVGDYPEPTGQEVVR